MDEAGEVVNAFGFELVEALEVVVVVIIVVVVGTRMRFWPSKSKELRNSLSLDIRKTC